MKSGLIVYNTIDVKRNQWFIDKSLETLNDETISLSFLEESELVDYLKQNKVDFIIYRGRNAALVKAIEDQGIKVYNNSLTNRIANDKYQTYLWLKELGFRVIESYKDSSSLSCPYIMKSVSGHGGQEVFLINNKEEENRLLKENPSLSFIYQRFFPNDGDVRIYLLNHQVVGAVLRKSDKDYRNNFSLGGSVSLYAPSEEMKKQAIAISQKLNATFIGVDLLLTKDGYLFNEIEDPVGSRMLYQVSDIDIVKEFLQFVRKEELKDY